jgi:transposase
MSHSYRGSGTASYHPTVLLSILVYGYATGVFSSRTLSGLAANRRCDSSTDARVVLSPTGC